MVKEENKEKPSGTNNENPQQINRVEKVEINIRNEINLWLVLAVLVVLGILLGKINDLESKLK